jgi:hypothetical protein
VLTDQQRFPTCYEPEGLREWRRDEFVAERSLRETGVSFTRNYAMAPACARGEQLSTAGAPRVPSAVAWATSPQ